MPAATFAETLKAAKSPMILVGAGALARDGRRGAGVAGRQGGGRARRHQGRLERLLRAAHRRLARRRARSRLRAGRGRTDRARRWRTAALDVSVPARRRRIRRRARRLRRLYRHPWRPRRASRRRDPAGRRLYGKIGDSTSTPRAGCRWRAAPRSRRATRARTGRSCARCPTCSASKLPYDSLAALRQARVQAAHPHLMRHRPDRAGRCRRYRQARRARRHRRQGCRCSPALPTSTSPIRSRGPPPSWRNARRWRKRGSHDGGGVGAMDEFFWTTISGR